MEKAEQAERMVNMASDRPMRAATPQEMADEERAARERCTASLDWYLSYPTARNFDGALEAMRTYQNAWMNGRERVVVLR